MKRGVRSQGFTLIEVLIAVTILALVMVTLGQTLGASARAYSNINETHLGFLVASDKLVEMQVEILCTTVLTKCVPECVTLIDNKQRG